MGDNAVEQIKEKLDVADVVKEYVRLTSAGKNLKGLCPFHKEKTPSFIVTPERQTWHCFGCSEGGDIFSFLMKYENLEFVEALKVLAEKAGVDLKRYGNADQKKFTVLYDINAATKEAFKSALAKDAEMQKYLIERGLAPETITAFELGFAPNMQDALMRYLLQKGYTVTDMEKAGVVFKSERGMYVDRFRNRVMFPLHNAFGKTIGFTGRIAPSDESAPVGKYVNSPETLIFNKSKLLFGFDKTKGDIRKANTVVLVEGQMDALMAWQAGVKNVIAVSGTALTGEHLKVLRRLADTLIIAFDNDDAGHAAAERAIDLGSATDFTVKVMEYAGKEAKDPAEIVKADSALFQKRITDAVPAMEYYISKYRVDDKRDVAAFKRNIRTVLAKIKTMQSAVERGHWLARLAGASDIPEHSLTEEMAGISAASFHSFIPAAGGTAEAPKNITRRERIALQLAQCALMDGALAPEFEKQKEYLPPLYCDLAAIPQGGDGAIAADNAKEYFIALTHQLQREFWKEKRKDAMQRHREAAHKGDEEEADRILGEIHDTSGKIAELDKE